MIYNFTHFSIALLWLLPAFASAQTEAMDLSLEQSLTLLQSENKNLRIAGKEVELAKNEHQKLNAFWYPTICAVGAYVHMSNPVAVVDHSHSELGRHYVCLLDATPQVNVVTTATDYPEAQDMMKAGQVAGILYLLDDFEDCVTRGEESVFIMYEMTSAFLYYLA